MLKYGNDGVEIRFEISLLSLFPLRHHLLYLFKVTRNYLSYNRKPYRPLWSGETQIGSILQKVEGGAMLQKMSKMKEVSHLNLQKLKILKSSLKFIQHYN